MMDGELNKSLGDEPYHYSSDETDNDELDDACGSDGDNAALASERRSSRDRTFSASVSAAASRSAARIEATCFTLCIIAEVIEAGRGSFVLSPAEALSKMSSIASDNK